MAEPEHTQKPALAFLRDVLGYSIASDMEVQQLRSSDPEPWLEARFLTAPIRDQSRFERGAHPR
jgi:hypothetical protein